MAYVYYNPNPVHSKGGVWDCAVRAIARALDLSWEEAYTKLAMNGYLMGDIPNSDLVWGSVLRQAGFKREAISDSCPDCYTVEDFYKEHRDGIYVIKNSNHVATVIDGDLYDSWDSSMNTPIYVWVKEKEK